MNSPLFSILIANYNNGKYFEDCYKSIIDQTYPNWEVIIVDDKSTDDSVKIITTMIADDPRFKFYENDRNYGCGYTKRRCAELAAGEICGFVDPDDAIMPEAIAIMVKTHLENENVGLAYSTFIPCDDKLDPKGEAHNNHQVANGEKNFLNLGGIITHFATFKKAIYSLTVGIDAFLPRAVDQDLYLKLYEKAPVLWLDQAMYLYRIHDNGISTNANGVKANYWHWVALMKMSERRDINLETQFVEQFVSRKTYNKEVEKNNYFKNLLKKSRWLKLGYKLALFKAYKYL